uniref:Uncharacterized protein n=1 Tax=Rhizophora mucronata TaxID=61149 RepID=A0A2P2NG30_RHIMU
MSYVGQCR